MGAGPLCSIEAEAYVVIPDDAKRRSGISRFPDAQLRI
jgi:hypothetical protein